MSPYGVTRPNELTVYNFQTHYTIVVWALAVEMLSAEMPQNIIDACNEKSTLARVMAWCYQAGRRITQMYVQNYRRYVEFVWSAEVIQPLVVSHVWQVVYHVQKVKSMAFLCIKVQSPQ